MLETTIIIPNYNGEKFLPACLDSLGRQTIKPGAVLVVDNGSSDGSKEIVSRHPTSPILLALDANQGFARAVNRGIEKADTQVVALLNNDTVCDPRWLEKALQALERFPEASMSASLMLMAQNRDLVDSAGDTYPKSGRPRSIGRGKRAALLAEPLEVLSPCAGAALYRRELFDEVGIFDESFFAYLEDLDLGIRGRLAGRFCVFAPESVVYHAGAATELGDRRGPKAVDSSLRVFHIAKNRVKLIAKHWPARYLAVGLPALLLGFAWSGAYHLLVSGQGNAYLRGLSRGLGQAWKDRRQPSRRDCFQALYSLMEKGARPLPP